MSAGKSPSPGALLRACYADGCIAMPGVFNALIAMMAERAGAAGVQIEDQQLPKRCGHLLGQSLVNAEEMEQKIRAAVSARLDPEFVIVARTDVRGVEGFEAAVGRAHR